jgi:hypothetical protein
VADHRAVMGFEIFHAKPPGFMKKDAKAVSDLCFSLWNFM